MSKRGRVKDGTPCNSNPLVHDVCIEGICKVSLHLRGCGCCYTFKRQTPMVKTFHYLKKIDD